MAESNGSATGATGLAKDDEKATAAKRKAKDAKPGLLARLFVEPVVRLIRFIREVVAELRKVIWPTRKELIAYTTVVVVFVVLMVAIVWGMDWAFAKGVITVFGGKNAEG